MNIENAQKAVDDWIKNHGVRYFNELTNMAQLTEEVGEVARIISRRYGEQSEKDSDKDKDLGEELADVLFVLLCIANQTNTDLSKSFYKKLNTITQRDHNRHQNNPKLKQDKKDNMIKVYGIKNCNTVKKAISQLDKQKINYEFIDLKSTILSDDILNDWMQQHPDTLVNKRSTTYRKIKEQWLSAGDNLSKKTKIIQENQTVMKRPILVKDNNEVIIGFDENIYKNL